MSKKLKGAKKGVKTPKLVAKGVIDSAVEDAWFTSSSPVGYQHCYEQHPVLSLGGGTLLGASCVYPRAGYDIYVGLDYGMQRAHAPFPWEPPSTSEVVEVYFPITDGSIPTNIGQFKKMVEWLVEQLATGRKVHVGCIGGHGRTGMLLAAIVRVVHGDSGAGEWVRQHYCKSAIETTAQIKFLHEQFGIAAVEPAKMWGGYPTKSKSMGWGWGDSGEGHAKTVLQPLGGRSLWDSRWVSA